MTPRSPSLEHGIANFQSASELFPAVRYADRSLLKPRLTFLAAFEEFIAGYKSTATDLEIPSNALQGLNIDGDGDADNTSDEYDFMDDVTGAKEKQQSNGQPKGPQKKYLQQLQEVSDRKRSEILIELDDLDNVKLLGSQWELS